MSIPMKDGNWIPIDKNLIKRKKPGEPYTEIEAVFSLQLDLDNHNKLKSRNAYSRIWGWSRVKVDRLLKELDTNRPQNVPLSSSNRPAIRLIIKDLEKQTVPKSSSNRPQTVPYYNNNTNKRTKNSSGNNKFIPPTAEELRAYAKEIGYNLDVNQFLDSYESKGWLVGKNKVKMKSWKATVRTWQREKWGEDRRRTLAL
ncbi:MAG: hypothetical protein ACW98X_25855 [Promethearchaeota archaeon]